MQSNFVLTGTRARSALREKIRRRPNMLLNVIVWELRYCMARRTNWIFVGEYLFFLLFYLLTKPQTELNVFYHEAYRGVAVDAFSNLGVMMSSWLWLLFLGAFQIFLITDLVAHDLVTRSHELIMSSPVPTRVYIWGRYLAGLCIGLVMSLVLVVAVPLVAFAMHAGLPLHQLQNVPGYRELGYPMPDIGIIMSVWAVFVVPMLIFLTALGFAVGTLFPLHGNAVKILLCLGWLLYMLFGSNVFALNSTLANWELSTGAVQNVLVKQAQTLYHASVNSDVSLVQRVHIVRTIEQQVPDMLPWILPHLLYAGLGLLCVFLIAHYFRRFAGVSNEQLPALTTCV